MEACKFEHYKQMFLVVIACRGYDHHRSHQSCSISICVAIFFESIAKKKTQNIVYNILKRRLNFACKMKQKCRIRLFL